MNDLPTDVKLTIAAMDIDTNRYPICACEENERLGI